MHVQVGVDGCRAGWFAVALDADGGGRFSLHERVGGVALAYPEAETILVDMPIGLPAERRRACDGEARRLLGRRACCVFSVPCRAALAAPDYARACAVNAKTLGVKLSRQTWGILPKIRELDGWLQSRPDRRWRECHPELAFRGLNGGRVLACGKKTREGLEERLRLLERLWPHAGRLFEAARAGHPRARVADDDIVDALALAVAAWAGAGRLRCLPAEAEFDATGLPMEIVFAELPPGPA